MSQPFSKTNNLRIIITDAGSEVLTAMARKSSVYWDIMKSTDVPLKCQLTFARLHTTILQKIEFFILDDIYKNLLSHQG
jgi:hypothetical protein